ncbi:hypothetical protein R5W24_001015 [Gemmata sp. JC717]|uniref:hypothetical protein n=1 Tax=Gemmata algarum TaxID=2975278 RepID=UPI0021BB5E1A|nr:hypothetical protein [Gemmata algarum]MDY3551935.1 hypothetical protein [Gemmata algarum]
MLNVTRELVDGIRAASPGAHAAWVLARARVAIVARHGGPEDADALLELFLEDPADYQRAGVLDAVMRRGTRGTARKLASACLVGGRLQEGVQEQVLHALGFLGYAEARDTLWQYAVGEIETSYDGQMGAALGLLSLSCDGLEREIESAVRACAGKNLFPEFLPILAHKVGNPELLPLLFDMGQTTASTDCNGGLVYGIALFGETGRPYFDRLLFDSHWETHGPGTGTGGWTYHGFRHLGGSVAEVARQLRACHSAMSYESWEYHVRVWLELVQYWFDDPLPPHCNVGYTPERAVDVCSGAFDRSSANGDDSLSGLVRDKGWVSRHEIYALRTRLEDRIMSEEASRAFAVSS